MARFFSRAVTNALDVDDSVATLSSHRLMLKCTQKQGGLRRRHHAIGVHPQHFLLVAERCSNIVNNTTRATFCVKGFVFVRGRESGENPSRERLAPQPASPC
jgi:hypothetical protein